jgi:hypothetical protein
MMYEVGTTWWRAETEIGMCAEENSGAIFSADSGVCAVVIPRAPSW